MTRLLVTLVLCWSFVIQPGRVVDGDTFDVKVYSYLRTERYERVRLLGVDTPEKGTPGYAEAKRFTTDWLARGGDYRLDFCKEDSFGRVLGHITSGGQSLTDALITAGHGVKR